MGTVSRKALSLVLAVLLAMGTLPQTGMAALAESLDGKHAIHAGDNNPEGRGDISYETGGFTITVFNKLNKAVREQDVPAGTGLSALNLPKILAAQAWEEDPSTPSDAKHMKRIKIRDVTWEIDPANDINDGNDTYDPQGGSYCFTPVLPDGYTLEDGVSLPEIMVTVSGENSNHAEDGDSKNSGDIPAETGGFTITAFDKLSEAVRQQNVPAGTGLSSLSLPKSLAAEAWDEENKTSTPSDAKPAKHIRIKDVTWEINPANDMNNGSDTYDPQGGSYCFIPVLPDGYTLGEDVSLPEIMVMVSGENSKLEEKEKNVAYLDEDGIEQHCDEATVVRSDDIAWRGDEEPKWYVVTGNVTIDKRITVTGDVRLILKDGFTLTANNGISVCKGNKFKIYTESDNSGVLSATVGSDDSINCAGIGGDDGKDGGNITINGGCVKSISTGENHGAAIGGGNKGSGGVIRINGGSLRCVSPICGAAIGGGDGGEGGDITITDGTVDSIAQGNSASCIGSGEGGKGGKITMDGGKVMLLKTSEGVCIGSKKSGKVTIRGGMIVNQGQCIVDISGKNIDISDGRMMGTVIDGSEITISGGTVTATGGKDSAGISGGNVAISSGTVTATGGKHSAGISGEKVAISGGTVTATGGEDGAGISGEKVAISGGTVTATGGKDSTGKNNGAGINGTFSTGADGNAFIAASSIDDLSQKTTWSGVIFLDKTGEVYGDPTLKTSAEFPVPKYKLTIGDKNTLTIAQDVTLDVKHENMFNNGIIKKYGQIINWDEEKGTILDIQSDTTVTIENDDPNRRGVFTYGDSITITAKAKPFSGHALCGVAVDNVKFWSKSSSGEITDLATKPVRSSDDAMKATLKHVKLTDAGLTPGEYTIYADFGGSKEQHLLDGTGNKDLTVKRGVQPVKYVSVSSLKTKYGENPPLITPVSVEDGATVSYYAIKPDSNDCTDVASISGTDIILNKIGDFRVKAVISQTNYYDAKTVYSQPITVAKGDQHAEKVSVSSPAVYGGQPPVITPVSVEDGADVSYSVISNTSGNDSTDVASISGTDITMNRAGTFYVKAVISSTSLYSEKTIYSDPVTIEKGAQARLVIGPIPAPPIYVGDSLILMTGGGSGDGAVTWSVKNGRATVDGDGIVTVTGSHLITIQAVKAEDERYASATAEISFISRFHPDKTDDAGSWGLQPDQPTMGVISDKSAKTGDRRIFTVTDSMVKTALEDARKEATAKNRSIFGIGARITLENPDAADLTVTLQRAALDRLVSESAKRFGLTGGPVGISFDAQALAYLQKQGTGDVTLAMDRVTARDARSACGITLSVVKDSGTVAITDLGSGSATLSVPYTPDKNEAAGCLYAVGVENGVQTRIADSFYNANSKSVIFNTGHFQVYGVGYTAPAVGFTDTGSHWAKESIDYAVGRGLFPAITGTAFSPDTAVTRAVLAETLGRLAGVSGSLAAAGSFTDVAADAPYASYVEWAAQKDIVQGIEGDQFEPDKAVTREEFAGSLLNYAKAAGRKLPITRVAAAYNDADDIGKVYQSAVAAMQQAGVMMPLADNRFSPKAEVTRAEVSAILGRYIRMAVNPATAQGWANNDSGQRLYYRDGKALTGAQTIGGVQYFFNDDGTLKTD